MAIRGVESPPEAAADRPENSACSRCKSRRAWIVASLMIGLAAAAILLSHFKPWLNANERRILGTWTWQDSPGEIISQFRADQTMRYFASGATRVEFQRWWFEGDTLVTEHLGRNPIKRFYYKYARGFRNKDRYPIDFNGDGSVTHTLPDGSRKHAIPWQSKFLTEAP